MYEDNKGELFENPNEGQEKLLRQSLQKDTSKINASSSLIESQFENKRISDVPAKLSSLQPGTVLEGNPLWEEVFRYITNNDASSLNQILLKQGESLDIVVCKDARGYSALAYACFKNSEECFYLLFNHISQVNLREPKPEIRQNIIANIVNCPTDEGFTSLHFATYHGNFKLITFLIDQGKADINKRNKFGSSVLHIAAQGDQALPLFYFIQKKGMDINLIDERKSTALHWACYSKSEVALNYLLAMNPDLEAQDEQGLTPLHLAVKSVEALKSTRPVRALLLKGAKRDTKDKDGKIAMDMISQSLPHPIQKDLKTILKNPSYWECLMIKTPLVKLQPSHKTQVLFWILMFICYFTLWFILFPNLPVWYYAVSTTMIGLKIFIPYIMATRKDPGILKPDPELDFIDLMDKFDHTDLCPDCKVIRTHRSRHCAICNVCVERYDHHCPWINNCVGAGNHAQFLTFICFVWVLALIVMCIAMDCLGRGVSKDPSKNPLGVFCFFGICNYKPLQMTVGFFDLIVSTIFFVPSTLLLYIHCKNFTLGKTTHERFSKKATASMTSQIDTTLQGSELDSQRQSLVQDEEIVAGEARNSKKIPRKQPKKRTCCQNWKEFMYNHHVTPQKELYEKQLRRLERNNKSITEIAQKITKLNKDGEQ